MTFIKKLPLLTIIILCATLGLAPFTPPHIIEKLQLLFNGNLTRPLDWLDLLIHGTPWFILILKILVAIKSK